MTINKKIHPIYFSHFVGTWKRAQSDEPSTPSQLKFNSDCTFEGDGTYLVDKGTVNGDVDEISVDDDGHGGTHTLTGNVIKGTAILSQDTKKRAWDYKLGIKNNELQLELRKDRQRVIYVGNLPLSDDRVRKNKNKRVKV